MTHNYVKSVYFRFHILRSRELVRALVGLFLSSRSCHTTDKLYQLNQCLVLLVIKKKSLTDCLSGPGYVIVIFFLGINIIIYMYNIVKVVKSSCILVPSWY